MAVNASSFERFAQKCFQMPTAIKEVERSGIGAAAQVTKTSILGAARATGWPTQRRTVGGRTKGFVAVRYELSPNRALVRGTGFSAMFEKGAKPHRIPRERGRRSGRLVSVPGVGVFDHVDHPGFQGRPFWDKGIAVARPLIGKSFQTGLQAGLRRAFR